MRRLLTVLVLLVGLVVVSAAEAKLNPTFSERVAEPGDVIELDLGEWSEQLLGPPRMIYLVPLGMADELRDEDDPRLIKIGELGAPGDFEPTPILRFEVPDVPAGDYTAAIRFKGYATRTWAIEPEGVRPLLTIRSGAQSAGAVASEGRGGLPLWAVGLAAGVLLAAVGGWLWRRSVRRPAMGVSLR